MLVVLMLFITHARGRSRRPEQGRHVAVLAAGQDLSADLVPTRQSKTRSTTGMTPTIKHGASIRLA